MNCVICSGKVEIYVHILLHCPLAKQTWLGTAFEERLWRMHFNLVDEGLHGVGGKLPR